MRLIGLLLQGELSGHAMRLLGARVAGERGRGRGRERLVGRGELHEGKEAVGGGC